MYGDSIRCGNQILTREAIVHNALNEHMFLYYFQYSVPTGGASRFFVSFFLSPLVRRPLLKSAHTPLKFRSFRGAFFAAGRHFDCYGDVVGRS